LGAFLERISRLKWEKGNDNERWSVALLVMYEI
jgi:hypothetical protein